MIGVENDAGGQPQTSFNRAIEAVQGAYRWIRVRAHRVNRFVRCVHFKGTGK